MKPTSRKKKPVEQFLDEQDKVLRQLWAISFPLEPYPIEEKNIRMKRLKSIFERKPSR